MRYLLLLGCVIFSMTCSALSLRSDMPSRYVVQPGDTLWSIANRYLNDPWEWKSLWRANPSIKRPNRLYPGSVIVLEYAQKRPYLRVLPNGAVKLSPHPRTSPLNAAIPAIPLSEIRPFLNGSLVLDRNALAHAPYVVAFTPEHLLGGQGDEVYVKRLCPPPYVPSGSTVSYGIFRPGVDYFDNQTGAFLGHKATLIGYAELVRAGEPATVVLTEITQGVKLHDRVMPNTHPDFDLFFDPKAPARPIMGSIIDLPGDYSMGAAGLVVVLNRGKEAGLQAGDVLGVYTSTQKMRDIECPFGCVEIPPERIGEVMVFRTFSHTSFALVVRAKKTIHIDDNVTNP